MTLAINSFASASDRSINWISMAGLPRLPRALAVNSVLAHQDHGVGQKIESDRKPPPFHAHAKFILFQVPAAVFIDGHLLTCYCTVQVPRDTNPELLPGSLACR